MATAIDIAHALLERAGRMSTARLHKLLYYVQAWSLAQNGSAAYASPIKAWENGPVVPDLHAVTTGRRYVTAADLASHVTGAPTAADVAMMGFVLDQYGPLETHHLIDLAHYEKPWADARARGLESAPITPAKMTEYYSGKTPEGILHDYKMAVARRITDEDAAALTLLAQ